MLKLSCIAGKHAQMIKERITLKDNNHLYNIKYVSG